VEILKQEKKTLLKELSETKAYSKALEDENSRLQYLNDKQEQELNEIKEFLKKINISFPASNDVS
jgi:hypothetical protein